MNFINVMMSRLLILPDDIQSVIWKNVYNNTLDVIKNSNCYCMSGGWTNEPDEMSDYLKAEIRCNCDITYLKFGEEFVNYYLN